MRTAPRPLAACTVTQPKLVASKEAMLTAGTHGTLTRATDPEKKPNAAAAVKGARRTPPSRPVDASLPATTLSGGSGSCRARARR